MLPIFLIWMVSIGFLMFVPVINLPLAGVNAVQNILSLVEFEKITSICLH